MVLEYEKIVDHYPYELLLLADETKEAIHKYLFESDVYTVYVDGSLGGVFCLYTIDENTIELKNMAISEKLQSGGIGSKVINRIKTISQPHYKTLIVGTADCGWRQIKFYEKNGFKKYGVKKNFFIDNYQEPIIENGIQLMDMVMLKYNLHPENEI